MEGKTSGNLDLYQLTNGYFSSLRGVPTERKETYHIVLDDLY